MLQQSDSDVVVYSVVTSKNEATTTRLLKLIRDCRIGTIEMVDQKEALHKDLQSLLHKALFALRTTANVRKVPSGGIARSYSVSL